MTAQYSVEDINSINQHLEELVTSPEFIQADRLILFLRHVVNKELDGSNSSINQYSIATEIYGRDASFDPAVDSVVRVDAGRLRTKLREYYDKKDTNYPIRFSLPKGNYGIKIDISLPVASTNLDSQHEKGDFNNQTSSTRVVPGKFPIVVLPLDTLSDNKEDQELADGIAAQIIANLSNSTSISVVSRRSAFAYKGKNMDARDIAEELDVSYILEGILRRAGNRVRVSVALIDALNGQQMWSETYQKELDDVFDFQDEIAQSIAAALGSALWVAATEGAHRTPAEHLNAAGLIHRAANQILNYSRRMFDEGEELVQRAFELDPKLGHVYTMIAFLSSHRVINYWTDEPEKLREKALEAANRSLELASNESWVLSWTADALSWMGEQQRAIGIMEHALRIEPDSLLNQFFMGNVLVHAGRAREGIDIIENALKQNPKDFYVGPANIFLSFGYTQIGDYEKAEETGHKAVDLMASTPSFWLSYINALAVNNKKDEAQRGVKELLRISPGITPDYLKWVYEMGFATTENAESLVRGHYSLDWNVT